jgi:2-(acetamidomethylene)succinate hydrolase
VNAVRTHAGNGTPAAAPATLRGAGGLVGSTVCTARGDMFVATAGRGPTLVLLHGVTASAFVWAPVAAHLAPSYRVVAVDQRGHGRTGLLGAVTTLDATWTAERYAADLVALARAVADGPVLAVGHSLGGRNALVAAAATPSVFAGVVAVDYTPYIEDAVFDALEARVAKGSLPSPTRGEVEARLRERYPNLPPDAVARRAAYGYRLAGGSWEPLANAQAAAATCRGLRASLVPAVEQVGVPVLFVRGADSALVSERAWASTRALRPDLEYREVPDADHYVPEERPEALAELVRRFAERLDRLGGGVPAPDDAEARP